MRTLTDHEKRTIRIGFVGIAIYLALFWGIRGWKYFDARRSEYTQLVENARNLERELRPYEDKALVVKKLMEHFRMDPMKLSTISVVAEASAAIQKAAAAGGLQLGPIRETHGQPSARELASMQLEGIGPVPAVMAFLHRLENLGYPLIVDSVQLNPERMRPGQLKLSMTILILDFAQWKGEEVPNA